MQPLLVSIRVRQIRYNFHLPASTSCAVSAAAAICVLTCLVFASVLPLCCQLCCSPLLPGSLCCFSPLSSCGAITRVVQGGYLTLTLMCCSGWISVWYLTVCQSYCLGNAVIIFQVPHPQELGIVNTACRMNIYVGTTAVVGQGCGSGG